MYLIAPYIVTVSGVVSSVLHQLKVDEWFTPYNMNNLYCKYLVTMPADDVFCSNILPQLSRTPTDPVKITAIVAGLLIYSLTKGRSPSLKSTFVSLSVLVAYKIYVSDFPNAKMEGTLGAAALIVHICAATTITMISSRGFLKACAFGMRRLQR